MGDFLCCTIPLVVYRAVLRSTDHGGIVNGGTALISYLFTKSCPPLKAVRMSRMVCLKIVIFHTNFLKKMCYIKLHSSLSALVCCFLDHCSNGTVLNLKC